MCLISAAPKIDYESKVKSQTLKAGHSLIIPVNISGHPPCTVTWALNGRPLDVKAPEVGIETGDTFSTLTVKPATGKYSGKFRVVAENDVGTDEAELEAAVIGKRPGMCCPFGLFRQANSETLSLVFLKNCFLVPPCCCKERLYLSLCDVIHPSIWLSMVGPSP